MISLTLMISIPGFRCYRRFATVMRRYPISVADKASRTCRSNVQRFCRVCRECKFLAIVSSSRPRKSQSRYRALRRFLFRLTTRSHPLRKPDCKARAMGYRWRCRSLDHSILKDTNHTLITSSTHKNCIRGKKI